MAIKILNGGNVYGPLVSKASYLFLDTASAGTTAATVESDSHLNIMADIGSANINLIASKVGIGTTGPAYKLDVAGEGNFTSYLNVDATVGIRSSGWVHLHRYGSNTNVAVGQSGTNVSLLVNNGNIETQQNIKARGYLLFDNDGDFSGGNYYTMEDHVDGYFRMGYAFNSNLVISTAGNVGIGTTSPNSLLHISSAGSTVLNVEATGANDSRVRITSGNNNISYIEFADPDDVDTGEIRYEHATNNMQFRVNGNSEAMRITSSGNVGIGTTSPSDRLDVTDGNTKMVFGAASSDRPLLYFQHNAVPVDAEEIGLLDFRGYNDASQDTRYVVLTAKAEDVTDGSEDGSLTFLTMTAGTATQTLTMRSSNVGIGTTSPNASLHIEKTGDQASSVKGIILSSGASGTNKYLPSITWSYGAYGTPDFAKIESERSRYWS
jgi:hypothetical protein